MNQKLIGSWDTVGAHLLRTGDISTLYLLTGIFERGSNQPSVFVLEHLMNAHLMTFTCILESGVINQIGTSILGSNDAIVSLRALTIVALRLIAPVCISPKNIHATVAVGLGAEIKLVTIVDSTDIIRIFIGTVRLFRTEYTHLVATVIVVVRITTSSQTAIAHEQEIIASDILDIRSFA